ncbi:peptide chain release factor N(5)-glutamine methyltransferase [bacterium]|nr:peptide chain release factor N(5)-glutamine methyltransferase [bacterium]
MQENRIWRLIEVLQESTAYLERQRIEHPRLNAERLLGRALGLSRVELYLSFDRPLNEEERAACRTLLQRRASHEPLQYILEETEFMSLPFTVGPGVLIPRPETELLVEEALRFLKPLENSRAVDLGTGSGCIAVSLAHYAPACRVTAVDLSEAALETARKNGARNGAGERLRFVRADILSDDPADFFPEASDCILANPPYISRDEWDRLAPEIREWEPREALCDEGDGLAFYRSIAARTAPYLRKGGRLMAEIGHTQAAAVREIFSESGFGDISVLNDLNGIPRVITAAPQ